MTDPRGDVEGQPVSEGKALTFDMFALGLPNKQPRFSFSLSGCSFPVSAGSSSTHLLGVGCLGVLR